MSLPHRNRLLALAAASAVVLPFLPHGGASAAAATPRIEVLSSRADLVSGGDALVQLSGVTRGFRLTVDGRDQSRGFKATGSRFLGLVSGLRLGGSRLVLSQGGHGARLTLTNHPLGGPVLAGPQIQPWACAAGTVGKQCSKAPT